MKYLTTLLLAVFAPLNATEWKSEQVTPSDVATILGLTPDNLDIKKIQIIFDKPQTCEFVITTSVNPKSKRNLPGKHSKLTFIRYTAKTDNDIKICEYRLIGENGIFHASSYAYDGNKTKFTQEGIIDGVYTLEASSSADFDKMEYQIKIYTK